jgi:TonB family protein
LIPRIPIACCLLVTCLTVAHAADGPFGRESDSVPSCQEWIVAMAKHRYPAASLRRREEGVVQVLVTLGESGAATGHEVIHSPSRNFIEPALDAARRTEFPSGAPERCMLLVKFRMSDA